MGTLPANLNIPNCINVNFDKPQGKMKIAVLCLVMVLLVVIKTAPMKEDQEMNIEGDELQEMNNEKRADAEAFERLLDTLDTLGPMAKRGRSSRCRACQKKYRGFPFVKKWEHCQCQ